MKFAKLSLAAAVALGTMTSVAAAKDLSEAIKGIDVGGLLRYEYEGNGNTNDQGSTNPTKSNHTTPGSAADAEHDFEVNVNFTVPVSEEITFQVDVEYDEGAETGAGSNEDYTKAGADFNVDRMYGIYASKAAPVKVMYGKQQIGYTPWSDGDVHVIGAVALYTPIKELTLAAYYFDSHDGDDVDSNSLETDEGAGIGQTVSDQQVYGAGAIVGVDIVSADLFYASITEAADLWAAHLAVDTKFEDVKVGLSGLYRASSVDEDLGDSPSTTLDTYTDGSGWGIEAYAGLDAVTLSAGWAAAEADEGTSTTGASMTGTTALDIDKGSDFGMGEQVADFFGATVGEETLWYVALKGKYMGWKPGITYLDWEREYIASANVPDVKTSEILLSLDYDWSKSFGVDMWYSFADKDNPNALTTTAQAALTNSDAYNFSSQDWEVEFDYKF